MRSVVLCGLRRFKKRIFEIVDALRAQGVVVYCPPLETWEIESWDEMSPKVRRYSVGYLTLMHFQRLRWGDVVWVLNFEGYVGNSTTLEVGAAAALGKPIYALEEDAELARASLYAGCVATVEEMVELLK